MNKIYGIIVIFAFAGLMLPTSAMQVEAASDLDYMLKIAQNAKHYIKQNIDELESSNIQDWKDRNAVLDIYDQSSYKIDQLSTAIKKGDVKSSRELFISSMGNLKQISLMLNQIAANQPISKTEMENKVLVDYTQTIKRYEMNIKKQMQFSDRLGVYIDFIEIENLLALAKQNMVNGQNEKAKQVLDKIATKGTKIQKTLISIHEENKIIKAQALAERYIDRINSLIVQAKNFGLLDYVKQLETTKIHLVSANSTSQITKNVRIIITINNDITQANRNNLQQVDVDEIRLSQTQRITAELNQLETKAKLLHSDAIGSNKALYYVEKALSIIDNVRNNLDDSERKTNSKLQQIDQLLSIAEKIVKEST